MLLKANTGSSSSGRDVSAAQYAENAYPSDSDEEDEFDVVNPLYEHRLAGQGRFDRVSPPIRKQTSGEQPPAQGSSSSTNAGGSQIHNDAMMQNHGMVRNRMEQLALFWNKRIPQGIITAKIIKIHPPLQHDIAMRISLNGECVRLSGAELQRKFSIKHYNVYESNSDLNLDQLCELTFEVNDVVTDSFVGSGCIQHVDKLPSNFSIAKIPLNQTNVLEVEIHYHKQSVVEKMALVRNFAFVQQPKRVYNRIKNGMNYAVTFLVDLWKRGVPGLKGGAVGSLSIMAAICTPFLLSLFFTNWSWSTKYLIFIIPMWFYFTLCLPVLLGWLFGTSVTEIAMASYPGKFKVEALHLYFWIQQWSLHIRVTVNGMSLGNPPMFPITDFFSCQRADICGSVSFAHVRDMILMRYKKCPLRKVPDFKLLAKFDIDYIEVDHFFLDFQLYQGKFNINELTRQIADNQAKGVAWLNGYYKKGDPWPNELEIRIIRAKNLVKTKEKKKKPASTTGGGLEETAQTAQNEFQAIFGAAGDSGLMNAFMEDDEEDAIVHTEDNNNNNEDEEEANESQSEREKESKASASTPTNQSSTLNRNLMNRSFFPEFQPLKGAPPLYNPMDHTVHLKTNQGTFNPYVVVKLRRDTQKTSTQTLTSSPMFNQTFFFHVEDSSTVVHVVVYNRTSSGGDVMLGQWLMTLKFLLSDPYFCWHEKGLDVSKDRWVRGWFPLMNKRFRGIGKCGKIEMAMQWRHVPEEKLKRKREEKHLTAMAQMQENSEESRLRFGDMGRIKYWLNHEPFLYDIKRFSVFKFKMFIKDLFAVGKEGAAERSKDLDKLHYIEINRVDWITEFRPVKPDIGITTYKALYIWFRGIAPKVLDLANSRMNLGSTVGVLTSSMIGNNLTSFGQKILKGEITKTGLIQSVAKSIGSATSGMDRAIQVMHRNITVNQQMEKEFKQPVTADDEDFLIDVPIYKAFLSRGYAKAPHKDPTDVDMEKEVKRKGTFVVKDFELKGRTLFFKSCQSSQDSGGGGGAVGGGAGKEEKTGASLFAITYKIPLDSIQGAIYFTEQQELMFNHGDYFTRLRVSDNPKFPTLEGELSKLIPILREKGVDVYIWQRGENTSFKLSENI